MTAADQTPAKRCGECRLGLGVHTTTDPYCDHHQTPATDSERVEQIRARVEATTPGPWPLALNRAGHLHFTTGPFTAWNERQRQNVEFVAAARDDIPWLLALLAEQAATIKLLIATRTEDLDYQRGLEASITRVTSLVRNVGNESMGPEFVACYEALTALGSQRTEGQG